MRAAGRPYSSIANTLPLSRAHIPDGEFLEQCCRIATSDGYVYQGTRRPEPIRAALPSQAIPKVKTAQDRDEDYRRHVVNYADAYTDTHGTICGQPFVYKTGPPWPQRTEPSYHIVRFSRELRPVNNHPITDSWDGILTDVEAYLKEVGQAFTAVMGVGFANQEEPPFGPGLDLEPPFCPLVMTIGVEPETVAFEDAKTIADYVKANILGKAGFPDIDVAIWEFTTSFFGTSGPRLPPLDPVFDLHTTPLRAPFTSTLGIPISPFKDPYVEGTVGLFLTRGEGKDDILGLTAAHVVSPPFVDLNNMRRPEMVSPYAVPREEIAVLGIEAYERAVTRLVTEIGSLQLSIKTKNERISELKEELELGKGNADRVSFNIKSLTIHAGTAECMMKMYDTLHTSVTKSMSVLRGRSIGCVLHADPIGASDGPPGSEYTNDWAVIKIREDAFKKEGFLGNRVFIHDRLRFEDETFAELMFPNVAERKGSSYPAGGLLEIRGVVPADEMRVPTQLNAHGEPAMPVLKNGGRTGTTVGWLNGLKSLVRHSDYANFNVDFTSRETTIIPYSAREGPFAAPGDSGSIILERTGRVVGMLTGGGGTPERAEVAFATAYCDLEKRIAEVLPGTRIYDYDCPPLYPLS